MQGVTQTGQGPMRCMHGGVKLHNKGRVQGIYIHIANYTNAAQSHEKSLRLILVSW
jgi:hypothetical protein